MASNRRRRSLVARLWASGLLQSLATELVVLAGLVAIGVGISQWSIPATWVYGGAVLVLIGLALAFAESRASARPQERT